MVIMGIRNKPITLALVSNGRMTYSFTSIGMPRPIICICIPCRMKNRVAL